MDLNLSMCARMQFRFSLSKRASCAQCAPEMPAEPAELVLRMFQLYVGDQAGLSPCSGSFRLQSETTREDRSMFRLKNRASPESQRSAPK